MEIYEIESVLYKNFNPDFIYVDDMDDDMVNIIISSRCFINQKIPDRIRSVYDTLEKECPTVFETKSIFVAALTLEELNGSLDLFLEEINEETNQ